MTAHWIGVAGLVAAVVTAAVFLGRHGPQLIVRWHRWALLVHRSCDLDSCLAPRRAGSRYCCDAHDAEHEEELERRGYFEPKSDQPVKEESWPLGISLLAVSVGLLGFCFYIALTR